MEICYMWMQRGARTATANYRDPRRASHFTGRPAKIPSRIVHDVFVRETRHENKTNQPVRCGVCDLDVVQFLRAGYGPDAGRGRPGKQGDAHPRRGGSTGRGGVSQGGCGRQADGAGDPRQGAGRSEPIRKAEVAKSDSGRSVLRVSAGAAEAEFSLGPEGYVKINPGRNAASVEVRTERTMRSCPIFLPMTWSSTRSAWPCLHSPCRRRTSSCSSLKGATRS